MFRAFLLVVVEKNLLQDNKWLFVLDVLVFLTLISMLLCSVECRIECGYA
jgi:hypothetical protein